jgi:hypothetical protein
LVPGTPPSSEAILREEQVQPLHQEACELTAIMDASRISAVSSPIANRKSQI